MERKNHWETVYETKQPNEVSWTQENPKTSLDLIRKNIGCGRLLVEHNVKLVTQACSRVVVLATGILIFDGNPQDALNNADVKTAYLGNAGVH